MRIVAAALAGLLASVLIAHASGRQAPDDPAAAPATLVDRFLASAEPPLTSYRALRTLEAESRGGKMRARLTAWTSLDPQEGFRYTVVEESGSATIRSKVLRAALEAERRLIASGEAERGALTPVNYEFRDTEDRTGEGLIRLRLKPKRRDTMLIEGSLVVTAADADLTRVEGVLVKRPSFWTREVQVVRRYERIEGVRVPVSTESTARVLVAGRSTFSMRYEYESINGALVARTTAR